MLFDKKAVMEFLPHRDPFLFIDSVEAILLPPSLQDEKRAFKASELIGGSTRCHFKVDSKVKVLEGHFPGKPILPGVVQVEMMAQASSFLLVKTFDKPLSEVRIEVALMGVDKAKFRKPVTPVMDLVIVATLTKVRGPVMAYDCQIFCHDEVMSECEVLASLRFL